MNKVVILHSAMVEASRNIVAELGGEPSGDDVTVTKDGRAVRIVSDHALAVAVCPNFGGYPAFSVIEDDGTMRVLSPVSSWADCVAFADNPPVTATASPQIEFTRLEFMNRFTPEELAALKAAETTDPMVGVFWEQLRAAQTVRLDDARTVQALEYLAAQGYIIQDRKTAILAVE